MKFVERFLNRISLMQKILILFIGCVIIPVLAQNIFYYSEIERNIHEELSRRMTDNLGGIATKVEAGFQEITTMSVKYSNDKRLYECLDGDYSKDLDYLVDYQTILSGIAKTDLPLHLQVDEVVLYTDNPTIFNSALVQRIDSLSATQPDGAILENSVVSMKNGAMNFMVKLHYFPHKKNTKRTISFSRELTLYREYNTYAKHLRIELNPAYYTSLLSDTSMFTNLLMVDDVGRVLFSGNTYRQTGEFDIFNPDELSDVFILLEHRIAGTPITLYGYYDTRMISDQFQSSSIGVFLIALGSIVVALVFLLAIGRNLTRRTQVIVAKTKQIAQGDFTSSMVPIHKDVRDETADIERNLNVMSLQLQQYIEQEHTAKLAQTRLEQETTQAKLQALQSQVNPHFMFNALESIRLNALSKNHDETAQMIKYMSKMFRYLVDWEGDIVQLEQELAFLDEFLSIQKHRFGAEFSYAIKVEDAGKKCLLPKLILQPLVENACVHGVEATSNQKHIAIRVAIVNNMLEMRVEDNGGGIAKDRLAQLRSSFQSRPNNGNNVGLYNVYQRLLLHYKDDFHFEIDSSFGQGTVCIVQIPVQYTE